MKKSDKPRQNLLRQAAIEYIESKLSPSLAHFIFRLGWPAGILVAIFLAIGPVKDGVSLVTPWVQKITCLSFEKWCSDIKTVTSFDGRQREHFSQQDPVQFKVAVNSSLDRTPVPLGPRDVGIYDRELGSLEFISTRNAPINEPITLKATGLEPAVYIAQAVFVEKKPYLSSRSPTHRFQVLHTDTFTDHEYSSNNWIVSASKLPQPTGIGKIPNALKKIPGTNDRWYLNIASASRSSITGGRFYWYSKHIKFPLQIGLHVSQSAPATSLILALKRPSATVYMQVQFAEETRARFFAQDSMGQIKPLQIYQGDKRFNDLRVPSTVGVNGWQSTKVHIISKYLESGDGIAVTISLPGRASRTAVIRGIQDLPWHEPIKIGLSSTSTDNGVIRVFYFDAARIRK